MRCQSEMLGGHKGAQPCCLKDRREDQISDVTLISLGFEREIQGDDNLAVLNGRREDFRRARSDSIKFSIFRGDDEGSDGEKEGEIRVS